MALSTCQKDLSVPYLPEAAYRRQPAPTFSRFLELVHLWWARSAQRRGILRLDDRMLRDIGISRAEAEEEARKPFWVN